MLANQYIASVEQYGTHLEAKEKNADWLNLEKEGMDASIYHHKNVCCILRTLKDFSFILVVGIGEYFQKCLSQLAF